MDDKELSHLIAFTRIPRIGRARLNLLDRHFGSYAGAWAAPATALSAAGLDASTVASVVAARAKLEPASELGLLVRHGIRAVTLSDSTYPALLKEIDDYPPVLYVRGEFAPVDDWSLAIVGTRRATVYGRQVAEEMAADLSRTGITVVSGLARGIDTVAHRTAWEAGGRTIAVLACGLDMVYPPENLRLAQQIIQHGALVSEYPVGTQPRSEYFPRRNRIMSGLSLGVLIVEGDLRSGAMITARQALDQNREVFAVPGSIMAPGARGPNSLIQRGEAKLVSRVEDILEELNLTMVVQHNEAKAALPTDASESALLGLISRDPMHIDEIQRGSGLPISTVSSYLAMLELKGIVRQVGGMTYVRT
jgi:DNA processing protein